MERSASDLDVSARYRAIRRLATDTGSLAVLHIGAEETVLVAGDSLDVPATLTMAIGAQRTAREFFKRSVPSPLELENAIATVEDEVMRARALVQARPRLYTMDTAIRSIAILSGVTAGAAMELSIDALERTFDRLTAVVLGRPASHEGLPEDKLFAATLLILRELMHHLQFAAIHYVDLPDQA
jgi:exopolyphosphatase/pppGpp-phosphohydrolase